MRSVLAAVASAGALVASAACAAAPCAREAQVQAALAPPRFYEGPMLSAADMRADLEDWMADMAAMHPDLDLRTDSVGLARERARIEAEITGPMSRRAAWLLFARLNPHLRDGHNGVFLPDYRGLAQSHLDAGGRMVPIEVRFGRDGELRILSGPAPALAGARLVSINGAPAHEIAAQMLSVAPGDTLRMRRAWVGRRFALIYWYLFGDTGDYLVRWRDEADRCDGARLPGARELPTSAHPQPTASELYSREILSGDIGYLRVDSFGGEHREAFGAFAREAFAEFRRRRVRALIIDLRENPGGDDPPWQESLMEHITTRPYAHVSRYAVRITPRNADPGDVVGSVRRLDYRKRFIPKPDNPNRFTGPVYVLVGPFTYSAAIQFAVAAQDFGVARIAGEETGGLGCQTGQTQALPLRRTGLSAFVPGAAFTRPSGQGCARGVVPDVPIRVDESHPRWAVEALAAKIRRSLAQAERARR